MPQALEQKRLGVENHCQEPDDARRQKHLERRWPRRVNVDNPHLVRGCARLRRHGLVFTRKLGEQIWCAVLPRPCNVVAQRVAIVPRHSITKYHVPVAHPFSDGLCLLVAEQARVSPPLDLGGRVHAIGP
jgi:hypothetical protein